ncbi:MAG: YebC/PmpR family DNA-binding transcriptional regulator [Clostridia bacterium]|nr:YebC/PmpR family DNA-binding transcriptional regulator [Clostridia bacterium]
MSGHSKWSTIKRKKEKTDQARAKVFTKIGREIAMVVKAGGPNLSENSKLKDVIAKAKAANVPNENIERIIKKAAGEGNTDNYEEIVYEGYGPSGVAVVVETLTDNRNRTAGDMRHYFDKCGGNLGQPGSVMFMFERKGLILIEAEGKDEETVMDAALEAGAEDFNFEDGDVFEISTDPNEMGKVRDALEAKGYSFLSAEVAYVPSTLTSLTDEEAITKMEKLIDMLEENDDVQNIWHNWDAPEEPDED